MKDNTKKWEYTVTQVQFMMQPPLDLNKPKNKESMAKFKKMGDSGWELVQLFPSQTGLANCFWKREQRKRTDEWDV